MVVKLKATDDFYCLPGWKLDVMETLEDCMLREIEEELGIRWELWPLLFVHQWLLKKWNKHLIEFFYLIINGSDFRSVDLDDSSHGWEISEIKWIDLDNTDFNIAPSFVLDHLRGKTMTEIMTMNVQSIVSD